MGFFSATTRSYQQMKLTPRTPLWHEARFQLASLLLGEDHLERISPLLDVKGHAGDPGSALREYAAGSVLAALIGRDPGSWFDAAWKLAEAGPDALVYPDLLLAMALTSGTTQDIARAVAIRHRSQPESGECLLSAAMLTLASGVTAAENLLDHAAVAFVGLEHGHHVSALALGFAGSNGETARQLLWKGVSRLDKDLSPEGGALRAKTMQDPSWKQIARRGAPQRLEARARLSGSGGPIHIFPYPTLMEIAAPWKVLSDRCRENRDGILDNSGGNVRLIIECDGDLDMDAFAVEPLRARIPAGETWLQTLYPSFRSTISLEVKSPAQPSG